MPQARLSRQHDFPSTRGFSIGVWGPAKHVARLISYLGADPNIPLTTPFWSDDDETYISSVANLISPLDFTQHDAYWASLMVQRYVLQSVATYPGKFWVTNCKGKLVGQGEMFLEPQNHTSLLLPADITTVPGSAATGNTATS